MKNLFGAGLPGAATGGMAALLLSSAAFAAPPPSPGTITAAELQATVTFLADDLLEGRQIGRRGHAIAMRYVAAQFKAMGLEPAGTQGFFQPINFEERSFASDRETLTLTRGDKTSVFVNGVDLSVGPGNVVGPETISAPLVFVGFGLASKELGIDDYAGLDVRGKIVVALAGAPKSLNSEVAAHLARVKTGEAAALGAVGTLAQRVHREAGDDVSAVWAEVGGAAAGIYTTSSPEEVHYIVDPTNPTNTRDLANAIRHGTPLIAPAADGIRSIELANAILLSTWKNRTIDLPMDSAEYQAELDHRINTSTFVKKPHTPKHAVTDDFAKSFK